VLYCFLLVDLLEVILFGGRKLRFEKGISHLLLGTLEKKFKLEALT